MRRVLIFLCLAILPCLASSSLLDSTDKKNPLFTEQILFQTAEDYYQKTVTMLNYVTKPWEEQKKKRMNLKSKTQRLHNGKQFIRFTRQIL